MAQRLIHNRNQVTLTVELTTSRLLKTVSMVSTNDSLGGRPSSLKADSKSGILVINADDWGRDYQTTSRILECSHCGSISSVSAMVFMEDSERAAAIARELGLSAGLHLNFTTPYAAGCTKLNEHLLRISDYLLQNRFSQVAFHPGLVNSFEYVTQSQFDEFRRIYKAEPDHIDGHHHMHLCSNVLLQKLMPAGASVRRNLSFFSGEKGFTNRLYRNFVDAMLKLRFELMDFLFDMSPIDFPGRLQWIFSLAHRFAVELETHPVSPEQYRYLTEGEVFRMSGNIVIASSFPSARARLAG